MSKNRDRKLINEMLDGIEENFIEEAFLYNEKGRKMHQTTNRIKKIAVAALIGLIVSSAGVSVLAATNENFRNWLQSFYVKEVQNDVGKGVHLAKKSKKESKKEDIYYLSLSNIPSGYHCENDEGYIYYGSNKDTDCFQVAYFHLQAEFANILPHAKEFEEYQTNAGMAYIAESKEEYRVWILFDDAPYMVELRDRNKSLPKKELYKLIDGASISKDKNELYKILEWTKELQDSYIKQLEKYNITIK